MARTTRDRVDDPAWRFTVEGVCPEAQQAASRAADRDGLPLGAWMEAAIMYALERGLDAGEPCTPPAEDPRPSRRYF